MNKRIMWGEGQMFIVEQPGETISEERKQEIKRIIASGIEPVARSVAEAKYIDAHVPKSWR